VRRFDMGKKVKVNTVWLQSCSGCHIALLDLHQEILDLMDAIDIVYSPLVDAKEIPEADIALVEGAVGNNHNEEILHKLRAKSKVLIALGTCACFGGVPGLRNLFTRGDILSHAYEKNGNGSGVPSSPLLPSLSDYVRPVDAVVKVDHYIPGCPPLPGIIRNTLLALLEGKEPVVQGKNLCSECVRTKKKVLQSSRAFIIDQVYSPHELPVIDPDMCFLEQGVFCMGPATRVGCHERCLNANMPCRGCMGPPANVREQGTKIIDALSTILAAGELVFREDMSGTGYRYSLPMSVYPHIEDPMRRKD
jgi:F420-non-reducing hydrogenase small subunit